MSATQRRSATTTVAGSPSRSQRPRCPTGTASSGRRPTAPSARSATVATPTVQMTRTVLRRAFIGNARYARFTPLVNGCRRGGGGPCPVAPPVLCCGRSSRGEGFWHDARRRHHHHQPRWRRVPFEVAPRGRGHHLDRAPL